MDSWPGEISLGEPNGEDWEDWLRWDPSADANDTSDVSLQNDSPLQSHPRANDAVPFPKTVPNTLATPMIMGSGTYNLGLDYEQITSDNPFCFGTAHNAASEFDFNALPDPQLQISNDSKPDPSMVNWIQSSKHMSDNDATLPTSSNNYTQQARYVGSFSGSSSSASHSPRSTIPSQQESPISSAEPPKKRGGRKRKVDIVEDTQEESGEFGDLQDGDEPPLKKTSHNVIEKRYRNNLNDKIVELRNSVPSLRAMGRANNGKDSEDLEGLTPAHKLNKATVMAKATEYIRHLEKRNKCMADEMSTLKARLAAVEAAIGTTRDRQASVPDSAFGVTRRSREPSNASQNGVLPFLQVPLDQNRVAQPRLVQRYPQQHSRAASASSRQPNGSTESRPHQTMMSSRGGVMSKVMLGTMAGIMVLEGLGEQEQGDNSSARQLFSVPTTLLKRSASHPLPLASSFSSQSLMLLLKFVLVIAVFLYLLMPSLSPTVRREQKIRPAVQLPQAPSLASPVEVRRKAWLTALQSVWVPKHFLLEVVAVLTKMVQLSVRRIVGSEVFTHFTGTTKEEEAARIKAWDIAIDAQLAGGDAEVSYHRLLLTLMESGTLPDSPTRLMQKAVHFRVFFWEVANAGYGNMIGFKQFTEKVGRFYWDSARRLQKDTLYAQNQGNVTIDDEAIELLPDHLAQLVELNCDDVLSDEMIQRAWNLAWNKPSAYRTVKNAARDSVVEDHAIRSPLDAVAAWYTNTIIDDTLIESLNEHSSNFDIEYYVNLALSVAPTASATHVRALAAKAILSNTNRETNIIAALDALPVTHLTSGMNIVNHAPVAPDMHTALTLAKLVSLCFQSTSKQARSRAHDTLCSLQLAPAHFTLLTSVASFRLLRQLKQDSNEGLPANALRGVEDLASDLRVWVGTSAGRNSGLDDAGRACLVNLCVSISKSLGGWDERDSAYGSAESMSALPIRTAPMAPSL